MKFVNFQKFISSILIIQLSLPLYLPIFNPIVISDDDISDDLSWTKVWKEKMGTASSIAVDNFDNIYILREIFDSNTIEWYYFLTKLNNSGNLEWEVPLNYRSLYWFGYYKVQINIYNDIYIIGTFRLQEDQKVYITLLKYDPFGNQIWNKTWKGYASQEYYDIDCDSLGNIYIVGSIISNESNPYPCMYLVKLDNSGSMLWNYTWGGNKRGEYTAIDIDSNDHVYVVGFYNYNSILMKYNTSGYCEWNYTWDEYKYEHDLTLDYNGNALVASAKLLLKINPNGISLWNFALPSEILSKPNLITDFLNNIYIAENIIIPCYTNSAFSSSECKCTAIYLEKINSTGNFKWEKRCTGCGSASCSDIAIDSIENIYISGALHTEFGCKTPLFDAILMKNPKNFEGACIEIYYDLLFLITVPIAINVLIVIVIFIIRYRRKRIRIKS